MRKIVSLAAGILCVSLAGAALASSAHVSSTPTFPKPLSGGDFFGYSDNAGFNDFTTKIAGQPFAVSVYLNGDKTQASINRRILPKRNAIAFWFGLRDDYTDLGATWTLRVYHDRSFYRAFHTEQGQPARRLVIPFGNHTTLTFMAQQGAGRGDILLANPVAIRK